MSRFKTCARPIKSTGKQEEMEAAFIERWRLVFSRGFT